MPLKDGKEAFTFGLNTLKTVTHFADNSRI
jgi:hypothetical protein